MHYMIILAVIRVTILNYFGQKYFLSFERLTLRQILVMMLEQFVNQFIVD